MENEPGFNWAIFGSYFFAIVLLGGSYTMYRKELKCGKAIEDVGEQETVYTASDLNKMKNSNLDKILNQQN